MRLYLDGAPKTSSYDPATGRLSRTTGRLSYGKHRARAWSFGVVRGR